LTAREAAPIRFDFKARRRGNAGGGCPVVPGMDDPFDLERFVRAQAGSYETALAELRAGAKRSHWMWFVFPQIAGLGSSAMARTYAIRSLEEARAYLAHPPLGPRLRACVAAMDALAERDPARVLGGIDAVKLRSSLTLFAAVDPWFAGGLDRWFGGERDPATLARIG
jgi:uncharacterized protein (DUF1810 family)